MENFRHYFVLMLLFAVETYSFSMRIPLIGTNNIMSMSLEKSNFLSEKVDKLGIAVIR